MKKYWWPSYWTCTLKTIKSLPSSFFWSIISGCFFAFILWFVFDVLCKSKIPFITWWEWSFLLVITGDLLIDLLVSNPKKATLISNLTQKFGITPEKMRKYVFVGLLKENDVENWDLTAFHCWLSIAIAEKKLPKEEYSDPNK